MRKAHETKRQRYSGEHACEERRLREYSGGQECEETEV